MLNFWIENSFETNQIYKISIYIILQAFQLLFEYIKKNGVVDLVDKYFFEIRYNFLKRSLFIKYYSIKEKQFLNWKYKKRSITWRFNW